MKGHGLRAGFRLAGPSISCFFRLQWFRCVFLSSSELINKAVKLYYVTCFVWHGLNVAALEELTSAERI